MYFSRENLDRISEYRHDRIGTRFMSNARDIIHRYSTAYSVMRLHHAKYRRGWAAIFTDEHRFMNRVIMQLFEDGILPDTSTVLDIGTYDAMLPAVLSRSEIDAFGYDEINWQEMWDNNSARVNCKHSPINVATVLNYCHNWRPSEIKGVVGQICGNTPEVILMDREVRTPHLFNALWLDDSLLESLGISVVKLPKCRQSVWSDRDLLILED